MTRSSTATPSIDAQTNVEESVKSRILIVDDEPSMREMLRIVLRRDGYDVTVAANGTQAIDILRKWDADANPGSSASAIFQAWFLHIVPAIAGDDLGPLAMDSYAGRFSFVTRFLVNTLTLNDVRWCDDGRTPQTETCQDTVTAALRDAVEDLRGRLGNDMTRWRWDARWGSSRSRTPRRSAM